MITKADKGNYTVIIDKDKYEEKIFKLLNDKDTYVLIKNDLTKSIERKLNKFIFDLYKIDRLSQKEYFYLRSTDAIAMTPQKNNRADKTSCYSKRVLGTTNDKKC